jgi:hypothetical protein
MTAELQQKFSRPRFFELVGSLELITAVNSIIPVFFNNLIKGELQMSDTIEIVNGIPVIGINLVPKKVVDFIYAITHQDIYKGDVKCIIFDDENPEEMFGEYFHTTKTIVVHLRRHWDRMIESMKDEKADEYALALHAHIWMSVINTIVHESLHNEGVKAMKESGEIYEDSPENEKAISEEAAEMVILLAKEFNLEAPAIDEWGSKDIIAGILSDIITNKDEKWAIHQTEMQRKGWVYISPSGQTSLETIDAYYCFSERPLNVDAWPKDKKELRPIIKNEEADFMHTAVMGEEPVTVKYESMGHMEIMPDEFDEPMNYGVETHHPAMTVGPELMAGATSNPWGTNTPIVATPVNTNPWGNTTNPWGNTAPIVATPVNASPWVAPLHNEGVFNLKTRGVTPQQEDIIIREIITRMFLHIFNACNFRPGLDNPFEFPERVYTMPLNISDIPGVQDYLVNMEIKLPNMNSQMVNIWNNTLGTSGLLYGIVFGKEGNTVTRTGVTIPLAPIPAYKFTVNIDGMEVKRMFLPQNVNKPNQTETAYSKNALLARGGERFGYYMVSTEKNELPKRNPFIANAKQDRTTGQVIITKAK